MGHPLAVWVVDGSDFPKQGVKSVGGTAILRQTVLRCQRRSDGQLMVQHQGEVIAHQEAPPKAGALRAAQGALAPTPEMAQVVRNLSQHGLTRPQLQRLAALGAPADQSVDDENGPTSYTPPPRPATPRKQALWKAVHHAKLQGVSLRGIARQLGISRNTVRKYVDLPAPPINPTRRRAAHLATQDRISGHFP